MPGFVYFNPNHSPELILDDTEQRIPMGVAKEAIAKDGLGWIYRSPVYPVERKATDETTDPRDGINLLGFGGDGSEAEGTETRPRKDRP
jgi:hypothetical protein